MVAMAARCDDERITTEILLVPGLGARERLRGPLRGMEHTGVRIKTLGAISYAERTRQRVSSNQCGSIASMRVATAHLLKRPRKDTPWRQAY
jgi:hypothetical protein